MELGITSAINLKGLASRVSSKDISSRYDIGKSMLMKYMLINDDALSDIYIYIYNFPMFISILHGQRSLDIITNFKI